MPNVTLHAEPGFDLAIDDLPSAAPSSRASAERAVYQAMFELLDGNLALVQAGEIEIETAEGRYRFIDGVCFGAPDPDCVGASLAGWLVESERASAVLTHWRRSCRAVLVREGARVRITGPACALVVAGSFVDEGFATHEGRLVVAHEPPGRRPAAGSAPEIEIHGAVEMSELELSALAEDDRSERVTWPSIAGEETRAGEADDLDEDARTTSPPSQESGSLLSRERARAAEAAVAPADARPRSYAAPPAWELPRLPSIGPLPPLPLDVAEATEEESDALRGPKTHLE